MQWKASCKQDKICNIFSLLSRAQAVINAARFVRHHRIPGIAFSGDGRLRRFPFSRKIERRLEQQQEGWLSPV
jgi:hypothetical protein